MACKCYNCAGSCLEATFLHTPPTRHEHEPKSSLQRFMNTPSALLATLFIISCCQTKNSPSHKHMSSFLVGLSARTMKQRYHSVDSDRNKAFFLSLLLMWRHWIQPRPSQKLTNLLMRSLWLACQVGTLWCLICCDGCDIWHRKSCIELWLLAKHSHIQWLTTLL